MNRPLKKSVSLCLTLAIAASMLAGCSKSDSGSPSAAPKGDASQAESAAEKGTTGSGEKITLSEWIPFTTNLVGSGYTRYADVPFYQNLEKATGVHINYISPPVGNEKEAFSLMMASGNLPDLIGYSMYTYSGGPSKALKDGLIVSLNQYLEKDMPDLNKIYQEHPDVTMELKTTSGDYFCAPSLQTYVTEPGKGVISGLILRKDWLEELGLPAPTTMDELHDVLKAFKEKKGAKAPFAGSLDNLAGGHSAWIYAFGMGGNGYYLDADGKTLRFAPVTENYKKMLTLLAQWYKEGLIDKDFITDKDQKQIDAKATSGQAGCWYGSNNSQFLKYLQLKKSSDPKYALCGAPVPVFKKGDTPVYGCISSPHLSGADVSITTANKHPEESAKYLNYGYTKEGYLLNNYGVEGDTYTMKDGQPVYTDKILKPSKPSVQVISTFTRINIGGPFERDADANDQRLTDEQRGLNQVWGTYTFHKTLPRLQFTDDEVREMTRYSAVYDRRDEYAAKFITGQLPMSKWDDYIKDLEGLGVREDIKIHQAAWDRMQKG